MYLFLFIFLIQVIFDKECNFSVLEILSSLIEIRKADFLTNYKEQIKFMPSRFFLSKSNA